MPASASFQVDLSDCDPELYEAFMPTPQPMSFHVLGASCCCPLPGPCNCGCTVE